MRGIILVGHGGIPADYPRERVTKLRTLEARRRATGGPPTAEEMELDRELRHWPRTPKTDPYRSGLEALASELKPFLNGERFAIAYNEFCAPTLQEAVRDLVVVGVKEIVVVPSMLTPGGSHSEIEIPEALERLRRDHRGVSIRYAWPFDLTSVAGMLASQIARFQA